MKCASKLLHAILLLLIAQATMGFLGQSAFPLRCVRPLTNQRDACGASEDFDASAPIDIKELQEAAEQATPEQREACCSATKAAADSDCYCDERVIQFFMDEGWTKNQIIDAFGVPALDPPYGCNIVVKANIDGKCKPIYPSDNLLSMLPKARTSD